MVKKKISLMKLNCFIKATTPPCVCCLTFVKSNIRNIMLCYQIENFAKFQNKYIFSNPLRVTDQDQDQDSLLVKRRNDNHSPGHVTDVL